MSTALEVSDCILRAPFDGEIATRTADPGAFTRPGSAIVSIVDRSVIRLTADAPEVDFNVVAPATKVKVRVLALGKDLVGSITRRAPSADPGTRTVRFEIDLPDPERQIPVGTTGEVHIDVGEPVPATEVPLSSTSVRGTKASLFVIEGDVARARTVGIKGESGGSLFVDTNLEPGSLVVTEGRALLEDGDRVTAQREAPAPTASPAAPAVDRPKERP
jgi:RND family efflux transporter MFP subunit